VTAGPNTVAVVGGASIEGNVIMKLEFRFLTTERYSRRHHAFGMRSLSMVLAMKRVYPVP